MKRLILAILLMGAFGGGYYLGHLPGSPDIFAWAADTYSQAADAGHKLAAVVNGETNNLAETVAAEELVIKVEGKTYRITPQDKNEPSPRR